MLSYLISFFIYANVCTCIFRNLMHCLMIYSFTHTRQIRHFPRIDEIWDKSDLANLKVFKYNKIMAILNFQHFLGCQNLKCVQCAC